MGSKPYNKVVHTNIKVLYAGEGRVTTNDVIENFDKSLLKELSKDELQNIIKEHESEKTSSSCGGHSHSHDHDHNHEHDHEHNHEGGHKKACQKKMKAQHPFIFR